MNDHQHIKALLMYEVEKALEAIQRRGVGYIEGSYTGGVDYAIDGVVYSITIEEREEA